MNIILIIGFILFIILAKMFPLIFMLLFIIGFIIMTVEALKAPEIKDSNMDM